MKKTWLVTGGAGFIGSNFICGLLKKRNDLHIINLDALTYAGNLENLREVEGCKSYTFIKGDICDRDLVSKIFKEYDIDTVINFAAESHVDRSIDGPAVFLKTNTEGTQVLLDAALRAWKKHPDDKYSKDFLPGKKFVQISTDEVYGALRDDSKDKFEENTPIAPNSPYSASKASADMMARAYFVTFGLPVNITRCTNNYGPKQYPEKLIPLMVKTALAGGKLPVYGDGLNVRDWIHVSDHCAAIELVAEKGIPGEIYNIGSNNEHANIEIVKDILSRTGRPESLIEYVKDRPGHDRRYAIDSSKIRRELGWSPAVDFKRGLADTIDWYISEEKRNVK